MKGVLTMKAIHAKGNAFAQAVHDACALCNKNNKKYQRMGLQFMDHEWRQNHVVCLCFQRCTDGRDQALAERFRSLVKERFEMDFDKVVASII